MVPTPGPAVPNPRVRAVAADDGEVGPAAAAVAGAARWPGVVQGGFHRVSVSRRVSGLAATISNWPPIEVASQPLAFWAHKFEAADACVTPVLTIDEAQAHPLFAGQALVQAWQAIA